MKEKNMADSKLKKEIERGSYKNCIRIKGAREHNLKGIDVDIPRDKLVVLTGLSGSGSRALHLIQYMQKVREGIWNRCLHMQDSSWGRWKSLMLTVLKDFHRLFL